MTFEGDQFVKNEKKTWGPEGKDVKLLQLSDSDFSGQPIGSFAQVRDGYRNAEADSKVLAGSQLNDEDDARTTLESLKSSETIKNQKMSTPEVKEALF